MPLALFIPPQVFLVHLQLSELYMAWIHTEIVDTTGPLELILNTPSHHRVHHSRNPEYIDKNYGGMLIIWDRLFDTFKAEDKTNPPVFGLVHPVRSFNPLRLQFHPWPIIWRRLKRYDDFSDKLRVIFYGPGWRPGLNRLGDPTELPKIVRPINSYNPQLNRWQNFYVIVHFGLLLLFYHELTLHQYQFSPAFVNIGVIALLTSIISLGLMLDNKHRYSTIYELTRCILFLLARQSISTILDQGLERTGINYHYRTVAISAIQILFLLSVLINTLFLLMRYVAANHQSSLIKLKVDLTVRLGSQKTKSCRS